MDCNGRSRGSMRRHAKATAPLRRGAESAARDCPARRVGTAPRHHAAAGIQRPPPSSQEVLHLLLLISVSLAAPLVFAHSSRQPSVMRSSYSPPAPPRLGGHPVSPVTTGVATDMSMRPGAAKLGLRLQPVAPAQAEPVPSPFAPIIMPACVPPTLPSLWLVPPIIPSSSSTPPWSSICGDPLLIA
ncbi:hypothetical protein ACCO45_013674 [Purpureocillium lilacinum]|uniref:Uncharacterized protein n=1 Tax=Purpureocillium lilacinum TaxID=33203 RepID=A0ACC4D779_PURLI